MTLDNPGDSYPRPDPTRLTTEQLVRELGNLERQLLAEVHHRGELTDDKFDGVLQKFSDLEARTLEQKRDTKDALDAALAAQKEAVKEQTLASEKSIIKSETATSERIKGVEGLLSTTSKASDDKIDDLKDRVQRLESRAQGVGEGAATVRQSNDTTRAVLASAIGVMVFVIVVAGFVIGLVKK